MQNNYTTEFFAKYREYLEEPQVRKNHNNVIDMFGATTWPKMVVDLGCGVGEYFDHGVYHTYEGFDLQQLRNDVKITVTDHTNITFFPEKTDTFVSLFSIECVAPQDRCYELYDLWFKNNPKVHQALVAGFYYLGKEDQALVKEAGGIESFQSVKPFAAYNVCFKETRILMHTPSTLFGDNVVEVWKILTR